jgi:hypothetical protein
LQETFGTEQHRRSNRTQKIPSKIAWKTLAVIQWRVQRK